MSIIEGSSALRVRMPDTLSAGSAEFSVTLVRLLRHPWDQTARTGFLIDIRIRTGLGNAEDD